VFKFKAQKTTLAALAIGVAAISQGAFAQTTASVGVSATVGANCIVSTTPIAFGVYNPVAVPPTDATGTVSLTCTTGAVPTIGLDNGLNFLAQRRLASGGNFILYSVFQPASNAASAACAYTTAYPATATPFVLTAAPSVAARIYNLCGRIPALQSAAVGTYSDTITATFTF